MPRIPALGMAVIVAIAPICAGRGIAAQSPAPPAVPPSTGGALPNAGDPRAVLRFMEARYREALQAYEDANFRAAYQIAEAILVLAPEVPFREDLRRLRREAQGRYLAQSVVIVTFEPAADLVPPLTELRGDVVVENHSDDTITFGSEERDPVLGMAHYRRVRLAADGVGETVDEGTKVVRMPGEFRVEPGAVHRLPLAIPFPEAAGAALFERWTIDGALRPITIRIGKEVLSRGVPWVEARGVILPDDLAEVASDPLQHLRRSLLTGEPRRFAAAAALWRDELAEDGAERARAARERLVDELLAALGRFDGELDHLAIRLLENLTGEHRERTVRSWQAWGLARQARARRSEERDVEDR